MKALGDIFSPYNNLLILRIAPAGSRWSSSDRGYARATRPIIDRARLACVDGKGVLVNTGGDGTVRVFDNGRELVIASYWKGEAWSKARERALMALATDALSDRARVVGVVTVRDARLLLLDGMAPPPKEVSGGANVAALKHDFDEVGIAISLPDGRYQIVVDDHPLTGPHNEIYRRIGVRRAPDARARPETKSVAPRKHPRRARRK